MGIPSTQLAQAALTWQAGGAASSAIGGYFSAASQKAALQGQAAIDDTNARISELAAQSAITQGQQQVAAMTLRAAQLKSKQRAALAANGVDLGEGSAAETLASTDTLKEIDANTVTANAVRNAWGYRTQATNFENDAIMKRTSARGINPLLAAGTSLLGSGATLAKSWYLMNNAGAFSSEPEKG